METTEDLYAQIARLREVLKSAEQVADQRGKELIELREVLERKHVECDQLRAMLPSKGQI